MKTNPRWYAFFVLFVVAFLIGCATDSEKKAKHMERARHFIAEGKYDEAVLEYKNVIQIDPEDDQVYVDLGDVFMKMQKIELAVQSYADAINLNQENLQAHLALGKFYLATKKTLKARKAAKYILEKSLDLSDQLNAYYLLAGVQIQEKNLAAAIKTMKKATGIAPDHVTPYLYLAEILTMSGDLDQAERVYNQAIPIDESNPEPVIALAYLHGQRENWDRLWMVFDQANFDQVDPGIYPKINRLAKTCEEQNQWPLAEKIYLKASESMADSSALFNDLAFHYSKRGMFPKAMGAFEKARNLDPANPSIYANISRLQFDLKDYKGAEEYADRALKLDPEHGYANFLKGCIQLAHKRYPDAVERFETALRKDPENAEAHYNKALAILSKGAGKETGTNLFQVAAGYGDDPHAWVRKKAVESLSRALEISPELVAARLLMAEIYLAERDTDKVRHELDAVLKIAPTHPQALVLLGSLKLMTGDLSGAETICKNILDRYPLLSDWHTRLGIVYNVMGKYDDAIESFQKALDVNPDRMDALESMLVAYKRQGKPDLALAVLDKHKRMLAENANAVAYMEHQTGLIYWSQKKKDLARQHFNQAATLSPEFLPSKMVLAEMTVQDGETETAVAALREIVDFNRNYVPAWMALGNLYYQQENYRQADKCYRRVLEIQSDHGLAANNLAFILSNHSDRLKEAYRLAQLAVKKMPNNADAKDTLGWLYYKFRQFDRAIAAFNDSIELNPGNALTVYHLGLTYYEMKNYEKARQYMRQALEMDAGFKGADVARAVLDN